ncbi:nucleoside recognition protein [Serpentinicella sp. ANB-PHB4]|uniref:nucleoside recognition domain-containing protein n=1 Tax=Serpentinicella sp. ANB-PHB4 TaxID=3074076 RepID=UPI0028596579|nr:nucleoside recognition domain-containing protein [Serpentinicella sp. ANB-PHB4]MDR5658357.1 nucleoside recognition protein [Serpentinicella sp. ANB-PHB4]
MVDVIMEGIIGSAKSVYSIAIIVIPIMITLEIMKDYKILDKISNVFSFITKLFNISNQAIFPLLVGFIFGLSYGAGVIIQSTKEGNIPPKDLFLISIFLIICHAVVEDTLIFVAVGANLYLLIGIRLIAAIIFTYTLSRSESFLEAQITNDISVENK